MKLLRKVEKISKAIGSVVKEFVNDESGKIPKVAVALVVPTIFQAMQTVIAGYTSTHSHRQYVSGSQVITEHSHHVSYDDHSSHSSHSQHSSCCRASRGIYLYGCCGVHPNYGEVWEKVWCLVYRVSYGRDGWVYWYVPGDSIWACWGTLICDRDVKTGADLYANCSASMTDCFQGCGCAGGVTWVC